VANRVDGVLDGQTKLHDPLHAGHRISHHMTNLIKR
jgi:hypothetical protein